MDPVKKNVADALQRQFSHLTLAEAYAILERHKFDMNAAARECTATFAPTAGDSGVLYEMPATAGARPAVDGHVQSTMDQLFQQGGSDGGGGADDGQAFFGSGRRLGYTKASSPVIPATVRQQRALRVAVYKNEIRVDAGNETPVTVIPLATPEAAEFMASLKVGAVPSTLEALYPNCDLTVELQDRMDKVYAPPARQFAAFADEGRRLGTDTGAAGPASGPCYDPSRVFQLDDAMDTTVVRVVNTKGGQTEVKVNPTAHTVEDLYVLAHRTEPARGQFLLEVRDVPPRKLGPETRHMTIEAAKLKRAVVVMRPT